MRGNAESWCAILRIVRKDGGRGVGAAGTAAAFGGAKFGRTRAAAPEYCGDVVAGKWSFAGGKIQLAAARGTHAAASGWLGIWSGAERISI